jgi:arginyl-tRNA synthetase
MNSETSKLYLGHILSQALSNTKLTPVLSSIDIQTPDPAFGDYSTNTALIAAKKLGLKPQDIAIKLIDELIKLDEQKRFEEISEKGGFINFKLSTSALLSSLSAVLEQGDLYGCSFRGKGQSVVVEYFQNNVAKPPHVGHLRSAVIGDCLLRVLKSQGYKAISDTHIGDWGVQFGILLHAYKEFIKNGGVQKNIEKDPINELNKLYVGMSSKIEEDPELRDLGKQEFVKLEKGDVENRKLWQWFVQVSMEDFERYRQLLDILPFDHNLGESFYEDKMHDVMEEFESKSLVQVGETGEKYIDLEEHGLGRCILIKSDGGTTYHLRDFATYIYRKREFSFVKNIYVVDNRQSHHFRQLFKVLELAGYPVKDDALHVELGFMSLPEGAISTRKGTTVSLKNLIDEAEKRALAIINEKNPALKSKEAVAKLVALAAIKYFDLSHNRRSEIIFTWEKALSFEGNTGPYLQYAYARIQSILRKSGDFDVVPGFSVAGSEKTLNEHELRVLRKLSQYPEVIEKVVQEYLPNMLCNYLFELSQNLNAFYETSPVIQETNPEIRQLRIQLITATAQVIRNGLYLLGIEAPEEM